MSCHLRREQCCCAVVDGRRCLRPARELGGYCTTCWQGLTPSERDMWKWLATVDAAGQETDEFPAVDVVAEAEAILRDALT